MTLKLYAHPLSSYCHKALIALYENDIPFEFVMLDGSEPAASDFAALWPMKRFPLLTDGARIVPESTMIVDYLGAHYPGPVRLIPDDADAAIEVRTMDRFFDNYVMNSQGRVVFDCFRPEDKHDPYGVAQAKAVLDTAYAWLDGWMAGREWAAGGAFSLADCAAAPALLYADWTHAIPREYANIWAYRSRLLARPSYARVLEEMRPYRHMFPLGAPTDRD
jgi:glutathione S-transferase